MSLRLLPNALTLFRMIAVVPIVYWLLTGKYQAAFILALLAGLSDLLDGFLARRFGWLTHYGGVLDAWADKLLLVSATLTLAWLGHLPWWLAGLILIRDLVIICGGYYYHFFIERITVTRPTLISKWNTLFQILLVVTAMLGLAYPQWSGPWTTWLVYLTAATTLASGVQYVVIWSGKASQAQHAR